MIGTLLFGICVFAVGVLANFRLGRLQDLRAQLAEGKVKSFFPEGEVTAAKKGVMLGRFRTGDRVFFGRHRGNEVEIEDESYVIVKEDRIMEEISGLFKKTKEKK